MGDYGAGGFTYQTFVLQARGSSEWVWPQNEFGINAFNGVTGAKTTLSDNASNGTAHIVSSDGNLKVYLPPSVGNPDTSLASPLSQSKLNPSSSRTVPRAASHHSLLA